MSSKLSVASILKYGALILAFAIGYQLAGKEQQPIIAASGWILGFLLGLKLSLKSANDRRNG